MAKHGCDSGINTSTITNFQIMYYSIITNYVVQRAGQIFLSGLYLDVQCDVRYANASVCAYCGGYPIAHAQMHVCGGLITHRVDQFRANHGVNLCL